MRPSAALLLLAAALCASHATALSRDQHVAHIHAARAQPELHFAQWVSAHGKSYADDALEYARRLTIWLENLEYIVEHNAKQTSYWLGLNSLADLSSEEYTARLGYKHAQRKQRLTATPFRYADVDLASLPNDLDWRLQGAVSEVKNQAMCGSCWAFSTTGAVEGINAIKTGSMVSLSEQELVECDREQDQGCSGGLMDNAFEFIVENGGLDTEADYPYTADDSEECKKRKLKRHVVVIDGYEDVPPNNEQMLRAAVAHQPVSVAIEADQKSFQLYMGGVYSDPECGTQLDHGVLVVGYGQDANDGAYWIVKNSWGGEWGDQGYIKIAANVEDVQGLCGIAMVASYPTKNGPNPPVPSPEPEPSPEPTPSPTPGPRPKPSPSPEPVQCDDSAECPPVTTCCCITEVFGFCLQWGCCPIPKATCCEDKMHCCPEATPICEPDSGYCKASASSFVGAVPWYEKVPATLKPDSFFNRLFRRSSSTARKL